MKRIGALAVVVLPALFGAEAATTGQKDRKPSLKIGQSAPPRFLTVRSLNKTTGKVVLAEVSLVQVIENRVEVRETDGKKVSERTPATRSEVVTRDLEVSIQEGRIFDAEGKKVKPAEAWKRLEVGIVVLVSGDGQKVARSFRKLVKKDTLILLAPEAR